MFLAVYLEGFLPTCKVTCKVYQVGFPGACLAVWEAECLGDQVDPVLNNFHQTRVQGLDLCQGFLISPTPLTQAMPRFNRLDRRVCPRRSEWGTQVQRRHSRCWFSRIGRWKLLKGGMPKRGNREREGTQTPCVFSSVAGHRSDGTEPPSH
jgi:hypothetical protein